jgi:predicted nuclease of predicted toxin-antitoxin system
MTLWFDAHLSPRIARWIQQRFEIQVRALRDLGLRHAEDEEIWGAAREARIVFVTKDADFEERVQRLGPPPQILWLTCGNTSEARLKEIFEERLPAAIKLFEEGEPLVEIQ